MDGNRWSAIYQADSLAAGGAGWQAVALNLWRRVSGDKTFGHRFIGRGELTIKSFAEYEKKLRANGVIVRPQERREKIDRELAQLARKGGFHIHEDAGAAKPRVLLERVSQRHIG